MRLWLDPGHGGSASGAVGCGRLEKDDNLAYALELERQFLEQGWEVIMTRREDRYVSLEDRTRLERDRQCDLAISCHRNGSVNAAANGLELWLHHAAPAPYIAWAQAVAEGIRPLGMAIRQGQAAAGVYRGFRDDPTADYYANSGTRSPSMLIELGFVGNEKDNAVFDAKRPELCAAMVRASCSFLGAPYRAPSPPGAGPDYEALYWAAQRELAALRGRLEAHEARMQSIRALVNDMGKGEWNGKNQ